MVLMIAVADQIRAEIEAAGIELRLPEKVQQQLRSLDRRPCTVDPEVVYVDDAAFLCAGMATNIIAATGVVTVEGSSMPSIYKTKNLH